MTKVIAFDVNETLLDLSALDRPFEEIFSTAVRRQQWFAQMLQLSLVGGVTGDYVDFSTSQRAALLMLAQQQGRTLSDARAAEFVARMSSLPPHPEVAVSLRWLAETPPLWVVALTNSPGSVAEAQLTHAGLRDYFGLSCCIRGLSSVVRRPFSVATGGRSGPWCGNALPGRREAGLRLAASVGPVRVDW